MEIKKIEYKSVTGDFEIEVSERWANLIEEIEKEQSLINRKETRRHEELNLALDESSWLDSGEEDPGDAMVRLELRKEIDAALMQLTEKQREVFLAVHYYGYGVTEVAQMHGLDKSTVSKRLDVAEKKLKKFL